MEIPDEVKETILIVDDDIDFQYMAGNILRSKGYDVDSLLEGKPDQVLDKAKHCMVVLLDVELPGTDGVTLGNELKSSEATRHIPIILISANADGNQMFIASKADAFVAKPFSFSSLIEKIIELSPFKKV